MMSTDQSKAVILVVLDMSAGFNKVVHYVLFLLIGKNSGLSGKVLESFRPYFKERPQSVSSGYLI